MLNLVNFAGKAENPIDEDTFFADWMLRPAELSAVSAEEIPENTCPVLTALIPELKKSIPENSYPLLLERATRLSARASDRHVQMEQAAKTTDWLVRDFAPLIFIARGDVRSAESLRRLTPITNSRSAKAAHESAMQLFHSNFFAEQRFTAVLSSAWLISRLSRRQENALTALTTDEIFDTTFATLSLNINSVAQIAEAVGIPKTVIQSSILDMLDRAYPPDPDICNLRGIGCDGRDHFIEHEYSRSECCGYPNPDDTCCGEPVATRDVELQLIDVCPNAVEPIRIL